MVKVKKMLAGIGVCAIALSLSVANLSADQNAIGTVSASNVNLRSGPDISQQVLGLLHSGNKLTVLSHEGNWYKVTTSNDVTGWVYDDFVTTQNSDGSNTGTITGSNVNFRSDSSLSGKIIGKLQKGSKVEILTQSNNWYKIKISDGTIGWVSSSFVSTADSSSEDTSSTTGTVTGSNVNLRSDSNTSSKIIGTLQKGNKLSILTQGSNWYKIKTSNGTIGWVSNNFVSLAKGDEASAQLASRSETTRSSSTHQELIDYAKTFLGVKYVWAGTSPSGFDCSGFTKYVFQHFGININRVAADQATQGAYVNKADLIPGDLVFFDTDGGHNYINHVGIYIGNGMFIQSSSGAGKVVTSSISEGFYANAYMTARRVMN